MNYIISEEALHNLLEKFIDHIITPEEMLVEYEEFLKSKTPVEQITSGLVDDLCHDFGIWACKQWTPKAKFIVYIQKAGE